MKVRADRKALAGALKTVTKALPKFAGLPVLSGVRIDAEAGHLQLTCSDLDLTIATHIDADVAEPGAAVIPARLLATIVDRMGNDTVDIADADTTVIVGSGRTVAELRALSTIEWPKLPEPGDPIATLGTTQLHDLERVLPFVSVDTTRTMLLGVVFEGATIRATDSYRLAIIDWGVELPERAFVPGVAIRSVLSTGVDDLELCVTDGLVAFRSPTTTWTIRQLAEDPPEVGRMLRTSTASQVTFPAGQLLEALGRLRSLDATEPVRFTVDGGVAVLTCRAQDVGSITDMIDVTGDIDFGFAFNVTFLAEAVEAAETDDVTFDLVDRLKPLQIESGRLRQMLMPIRANK